MPKKRDWDSVTSAGPSTDGPAGAPTIEGRRRSSHIEDEDPSMTRRRRSDTEPGSLFDSYAPRGAR